MSAHDIVMPKLGLTMTEGTISEWLVHAGDEVRVGAPLFVVETEKIANEVEAASGGRIEALLAAVGDVVPVGAVVARLSGGKDSGKANGPDDAALSANAVAPSIALAASLERAAPIPATNGSARLIATPLARRRAASEGIDLAKISGSGPRGRVKAKDVEAVVSSVRHDRQANAEVERSNVSRQPATAFQKIVARRLTESKQTIPHFYVTAEVDITAALALRKQLNSDSSQVKISLTHIVIAAVGRALTMMPEMDAVWETEEIVTLGSSDVGVAVDTPRGLLVPVVRNAGGLSLDVLASRIGDSVQKAREGRLSSTDLTGGAISVSNVGMYGVASLIPVINPGQAAILGVAAPREVFRPDSTGAPVLRQELNLVLSCDHRLLDGVRAAQFLQCVGQFLTTPLRLLRG